MSKARTIAVEIVNGPATAPRPVASGIVSTISEFTLPELEIAYGRLNDFEAKVDTLSGAAAVVKGLLLAEAKRKLGHGKYLPWLKKTFPKSDRTASKYIRLAAAYSKSERSSDLKESDTWLALLQGDGQLELTHPVVASVVEWTEGKSSYQLLQEIGDPEKGGPRDKEKKLSPEEESALLDQKAQQVFKSLWTDVEFAQKEHRDLLLRLPAAAADPEKEVGLAQLRDILRPLLTLVEDALATRGNLARLN